jgi:hypothetical protein
MFFDYGRGMIMTETGTDFLRNPVRDPLYPFRHFGLSVNPMQSSLPCFKAIVADEMSFHAVLLMASASDDLMSHRRLSDASRHHLQRTLPLLNSRLSDANAYKDDLVLYVVGLLAATTILFGDYWAASAHSAGISQIIRLRGERDDGGFSSTMRLSIGRYGLFFCYTP